MSLVCGYDKLTQQRHSVFKMIQWAHLTKKHCDVCPQKCYLLSEKLQMLRGVYRYAARNDATKIII